MYRDSRLGGPSPAPSNLAGSEAVGDEEGGRLLPFRRLGGAVCGQIAVPKSWARAVWAVAFVVASRLSVSSVLTEESVNLAYDLARETLQSGGSERYLERHAVAAGWAGGEIVDGLVFRPDLFYRAGSPVFIPSMETAKWFENRVYQLLASPRIFPGQTVEATLSAPADGARANVYLSYYGEDDEPATLDDDTVELVAGESRRVSFTVPPLPGPIFSAGVRVQGPAGVFLEALKWSGAPEFRLERPAHRGTMWHRAWVNAVDLLTKGTEMFRLVQNAGMGLLMQGTREWRDYSLTAEVTPHLVKRAGIAVRVQGLTRFYGLFLAQRNRVQLVRMLHREEEVLGEADFEWNLGETYELTLKVDGDRLVGKVEGVALIEVTDDALDCGAVGLVIEEGRLGVDRVEVSRIA